MTNSAVLVVIDAQRGFANSHTQRAVSVMAELLQRWQSAGLPSVLTQFVNAPDSAYVRLIGWSKLMATDPAVELVPEIAVHAPLATAVIRKNGYTALTADVVHLVKEHDWSDVYIAGLDTESCVLATALGAFESGLTPWVLTDAVASHAGPEVNDAGLLVMSRFIGRAQLITTAGIPADLLAPTPTPAELT